jgi:hypothetical protein
MNRSNDKKLKNNVSPLLQTSGSLLIFCKNRNQHNKLPIYQYLGRFLCKIFHSCRFFKLSSRGYGKNFLLFTIKLKRNNLRHELKKYMLKRSSFNIPLIQMHKFKCQISHMKKHVIHHWIKNENLNVLNTFMTRYNMYMMYFFILTRWSRSCTHGHVLYHIELSRQKTIVKTIQKYFARPCNP